MPRDEQRDKSHCDNHDSDTGLGEWSQSALRRLLGALFPQCYANPDAYTELLLTGMGYTVIRRLGEPNPFTDTDAYTYSGTPAHN